MITNDNIPVIFIDLKEDVSHNTEDMSVMRCLHWAVKHGMTIEIRHSGATGTSMSLQLIKDTEPYVSVTDDRIEKGLWELELATTLAAGMKPMNGMDFTLELLRKGRLSLPHHNDIRSEVIMNRSTFCIGSAGEGKKIENDLYGVLLFNNEVVVRIESQAKIRDVLDNMEKALFMKRREE